MWWSLRLGDWLRQRLLFVVHLRSWEKTRTRLCAISTAESGYLAMSTSLYDQFEIQGLITAMATLHRSSSQLKEDAQETSCDLNSFGVTSDPSHLNFLLLSRILCGATMDYLWYHVMFCFAIRNSMVSPLTEFVVVWRQLWNLILILDLQEGWPSFFLRSIESINLRSTRGSILFRSVDPVDLGPWVNDLQKD